ncbi:MAG: MFS transporter [Hyphomonadaceae bacterium]|nr:MFS transporter [Hyphomonadaceae bacterium]
MIAFFRNNSRWIAGGFLLTFFSSFGQTFFIGLSGEELREKFDLSDGEFGGIYMIATIGSALTLPFLGRVLDHMPGWRVARFVIPALALACLLIAFAPNLIILVIALYALRLLGQGMMTHIAYTEIGRWFVANRGRATSLIVPGHQTGEALLPIGFTLIAVALGWQAGWVIAAILLSNVAYPVILRLWRVERASQSADPDLTSARLGPDKTVAQVAADPVFYALLTGVLAPPFIGTTIFFHQDYLVELRGYDPLAFAGAFPIMAITTIGFSLLSGQMIDRYGAIKLLPFYLVPLGAASLAVGVLTPLWGIYAFMFLVGVSYGFTAPLIGALWPEVYGIRNLGSVRAIAVAAGVAATAIGPGLTGYLIDQGVPLPDQMIAMSVWCMAASVVLALTVPVILRRNLLSHEQ